MGLVLYRVYDKPDGGQTRTPVERIAGGDGQQEMALIEKHLKQYPKSGWDDKIGHWAEDAEGRRYTFSSAYTKDG
jgi:hypothetical protein